MGTPGIDFRMNFNVGIKLLNFIRYININLIINDLSSRSCLGAGRNDRVNVSTQLELQTAFEVRQI